MLPGRDISLRFRLILALFIVDFSAFSGKSRLVLICRELSSSSLGRALNQKELKVAVYCRLQLSPHLVFRSAADSFDSSVHGLSSP